MKGPRVLLLVRRARGGIATHVAALVRHLAPHISLHLAGEFGPEVAEAAAAVGVPATLLPLGDDVRREDLVSRRSVRALALGADVVHAHGLKAALVALSLGGLRPLLYTAHGLPPSGLRGVMFQRLEDQVLRQSAQVFAVSPAVAANLARRGLPSERCVVLPPLFAAEPLRQVPPPPATPVLGTLARLERRKGVDLLLAAAALLAPRWPELTVLIGGDGPERSALEHQARQLRVASSTSFLGFVAPGERASFFSRVRLYVQPSRAEGLGLAVLEAAAAGRAAVVTDRGGLPATVRSGETGLVVPADQGALAEAIAWALPRAAELGARARSLVPPHQDEAAARLVLSAYERAARGEARAAPSVKDGRR